MCLAGNVIPLVLSLTLAGRVQSLAKAANGNSVTAKYSGPRQRLSHPGFAGRKIAGQAGFANWGGLHNNSFKPTPLRGAA